MAWNIGMAVIEKAVVGDVVPALGLELPVTADVRPQLPLGDAVDHSDAFWGIGELGEHTIIVSRVVADHQQLWERLSLGRRVLVFCLTEQEDENCLYIYEDGDRVVRRETKKGSRAWKPSHPFERRARTNKADYIADVFKNMTGTKLVDSMNAIVEMRVMPPAQRESIDAARVRFDRELAEPQPDGEWAGLRWFNRWDTLQRCLDEAWDRDPQQVVESWIPRVLDDMATWPELRRELAWERFDTIAKGRDDGRYTELAPLYRKFSLNRESGRITKWRAKPFARFFEHPIASPLTILDCSHTYMPPALGALIASSPRLENVRELSFDRSSLGNEGVVALARATNLRALRALDLHWCKMDRTALPALLDAAFVPQLEQLELGGNGIAADVNLLGRFPNLKTLGLWCETSIDNASLGALLESDALPALQTLDIRQWPHDPEPLRRIRPSVTIVHERP